MRIVRLPSASITSYALHCLRVRPHTIRGFVNDYLPTCRAGSCKREYNTTAFAFRELIAPYVDKELAMQVLGKNWLQDIKGPLSQN